MDIKGTTHEGQPYSNLNVGDIGNIQRIKEIGLEGNPISADAKNNEQSNDSRPITEKDVKKAIDKLNKLLEDKATHAEYEIYGRFKDLTIKIINNKTEEVVQELPPRKLIDMIDKLCELAGMFVDKKA